MLTPGQAHDLNGADGLLPDLEADALLADKAYDAIEAERQRREVQQHQQAIAQAHTGWARLTQMLRDLRQHYPGEAIPLNLKTPLAPPLETDAVDTVRNYRDALSQHLAQARSDLQHISDRAAALWRKGQRVID